MSQKAGENPHKPGIRIPVTALKIGMQVCALDRDWLETPFALQGFSVRTPADIDEIARYCTDVYVEPETARTAITPAARPTYTSTKTDEELQAAGAAHARARTLARSFMDDVRLGRAIDIREIKATVSDCVQSVLRNPDAMAWVAKNRDKDQYTSEHSLNVGLLAISFGRYLGAGEEDLMRLGIAGILHDVGKMRTPLEVLNKEGGLDRDELYVMQSHPRHGRDILMSHRSVFSGAVDVAHTHHEALDEEQPQPIVTALPNGSAGIRIEEYVRAGLVLK